MRRTSVRTSRVVHVQVRLKVVEAVEVVLTGLGVLRPGGLLHTGEDHPLLPVLRPLPAPDIPVPVPRGRIAPGRLEPLVLIRAVIDDQIHQYADPAALRVVHELDEVTARSVSRIDAIVVGDVVAVITIRARLEGSEPYRIDAQRLEVIDPADQALEVTAAVPVAVHERLQIQRVDDGVLVPEIFDHRRRSRWCRGRDGDNPLPRRRLGSYGGECMMGARKSVTGR